MCFKKSVLFYFFGSFSFFGLKEFSFHWHFNVTARQKCTTFEEKCTKKMKCWQVIADIALGTIK